MMPRLRVDKGAVRFVFAGAHIMCPGLTSGGATIHDDVAEDTPVAVYAEGKEHALAVGLTKMSTATMRSVNKGHGVETLHHLNGAPRGRWRRCSRAATHTRHGLCALAADARLCGWADGLWKDYTVEVNC